jgi:hypothetical protein
VPLPLSQQRECRALQRNDNGDEMSDLKMKIRWPELGITVEARSLPYNRALADRFWASLPFKTLQIHAMVSGDDLYAYGPESILDHAELIERRLPINEMPVGTIGWSVLGLFAIYYGPCTETLHSTPIAAISEKYHDDLKEVGRSVWDSVFTTKRKIFAELSPVVQS